MNIEEMTTEFNQERTYWLDHMRSMGRYYWNQYKELPDCSEVMCKNFSRHASNFYQFLNPHRIKWDLCVDDTSLFHWNKYPMYPHPKLMGSYNSNNHSTVTCSNCQKRIKTLTSQTYYDVGVRSLEETDNTEAWVEEGLKMLEETKDPDNFNTHYDWLECDTPEGRWFFKLIDMAKRIIIAQEYKVVEPQSQVDLLWKLSRG